MIVAIIPSVKEPYKNQYEFSIEFNLIKFINFLFDKPNIIILNDINYKYKYDFLVISGGGGNDLYNLNKNNKNKIRNKITNYFFNKSLKKNIPILGFCYGAQFIAHKYKSQILKKEHLVKHKVKIDYMNISKKLIVNSYHNYIVSKLGRDLIEIGKAQDNSIESFKHKNKKILGIMWHPERNRNISKYDIKIIKLALCT